MLIELRQLQHFIPLIVLVIASPYVVEYIARVKAIYRFSVHTLFSNANYTRKECQRGSSGSDQRAREPSTPKPRRRRGGSRSSGRASGSTRSGTRSIQQAAGTLRSANQSRFGRPLSGKHQSMHIQQSKAHEHLKVPTGMAGAVTSLHFYVFSDRRAQIQPYKS